jgi:hypothetical protein
MLKRFKKSMNWRNVNILLPSSKPTLRRKTKQVSLYDQGYVAFINSYLIVPFYVSSE